MERVTIEEIQEHFPKPYQTILEDRINYDYAEAMAQVQRQCEELSQRIDADFERRIHENRARYDFAGLDNEEE